MKKKTIIAIVCAIIIIPIIFLTLSSFIPSKLSFDYQLDHNGKTVIDDKYQIKLSTYFEVLFKHNGSYKDYYDACVLKGVDPLEDFSPELKKNLDDVLGTFGKSPTDAKVTFDKENVHFEYVSEKSGYRVDKEQLLSQLFGSFSKKIKQTTPIVLDSASVTLATLKNTTVKRGEFSTQFKSSASNRKHNIALAAKLMDGYVIPPQGEFSFNKVIGVRSLERGFLSSIIISQGAFVPGVGGGVCQASTTLYNAALLSGLEIVNVRHHSLPVSYVPLSRDAMVSSSSDLVFRNPSDYNVYISAKATSEEIKIAIFAEDIFKGLTPKITSNVLRVIPGTYTTLPSNDETLEIGQTKVITPAKSGYVTESYLELYNDTNLVSRTKIRLDTYSEQKGIMLERKE